LSPEPGGGIWGAPHPTRSDSRDLDLKGWLMSQSAPQHWLKVESVGEVAVVRFLQPRVLDEEVINYIGQELLRLVTEGCRRIVLDFRAVEALATHMLGELIVVHKRLQAAGGRLAVCELRPPLREVFELLKLSQVFHIYDTEQDALQSF
jgi:anti-sigma B factor antagonist